MKKGKKIISVSLSLILALGTSFSSTNIASAVGVSTRTPKIVKHVAAKKIDKSPYLNVSAESDPPSLDSTLATDSSSFEVVGNTMECLTRQDKVGDNTVNGPGAATKWTVSPDGKTWTFYLRKMQWSDGKQVTAKDFEYAWLRLLDPNHGAGYAYFLYIVKGAQEYNNKKGSIASVGVRALSQTKFQVILKKPTPYFEKILSFGVLAPIRKDIVTKLGDNYGTNSSYKKMVWCGPFTVSDWKLGTSLTLKKNPKYWDAKNVKLDHVNLNLSDLEMATKIQLFESKNLDMTDATQDWILKLANEAKTGKFVYDKEQSLTSSYLLFNCKDKFFKSAKVRKAFGLAVDRTQYTKVLFKRYVPAYALVPPKIMAGDVDFRKYCKTTPYGDLLKQYPNAAAWKKLLIEGLKEEGLSTNPASYTVEFANSGSSSLVKMKAEFLQNQWKKNLGVNIKIKTLSDWGQFLKVQAAGECQLCMSGWGPDYNDPMTYLDLWTTGNDLNRAFYSNKTYDKLISQASSETNMTKRTALLKQAERLLIYTDSVIAPIYYDDVHRFMHKYVYGMEFFDFGSDMDFKYAYTSGRK